MRLAALIEPSAKGLYCPAGDFYIDPWRAVPRAVITHAHADHARAGSAHYWAAAEGATLLRHRLGQHIALTPMAYGESVAFGPITVSLHPAGHVLGSAQVRLSDGNSVWVVSGDYKRDIDPTCQPFEPLTCDTFITEATFALPAYRWPPMADVMADLIEWWQENAQAGRSSVLLCYALGKAQRILAALAALPRPGPIYLHGAVSPLTTLYREAGITMAPAEPATQASEAENFSTSLIIAPPSAAGTPWMQRFTDPSTAFASGWMRIRGNRRRRGHDRGFVISDHVDWPSLLQTIQQTGAKQVFTTHGRADELVRYLHEQGLSAAPFATQYGEEDE